MTDKNSTKDYKDRLRQIMEDTEDLISDIEDAEDKDLNDFTYELDQSYSSLEDALRSLRT